MRHRRDVADALAARQAVAELSVATSRRSGVERGVDVDVAAGRRRLRDVLRRQLEAAFGRRRAEEVLSGRVEVSVDERRRRRQELGVDDFEVRRVFDVEIRRRLDVAADVNVDVLFCHITRSEKKILLKSITESTHEA